MKYGFLFCYRKNVVTFLYEWRTKNNYAQLWLDVFFSLYTEGVTFEAMTKAESQNCLLLWKSKALIQLDFHRAKPEYSFSATLLAKHRAIK